jgi:ATP-dependent DNA ligase
VREPFHRDGWVYEEKVDGWRIVAYKDGARVRLVSRNGRDHTRRFAGIAAAIAKLAVRALVLDGEVAIYDERLRSRFDWLREPDADAVATPPMFMAFDLLHKDGRALTGRPLRDRRARLENAIMGSDLVLPVRRLAKNGFEAWAEVIAHDYEGLVAKEEPSVYEAGPTRRWLKVKAAGLDDRGGSVAAGSAPTHEPAFGVTASGSRGRLRSRLSSSSLLVLSPRDSSCWGSAVPHAAVQASAARLRPALCPARAALGS